MQTLNKRKLSQLQRLINNHLRHRDVLAAFCSEHYGKYPGEVFGSLPADLDAEKFDRMMSEGNDND